MSEQRDWSVWIATMIGCYLGFDVDDKRNEAIAAIIQRRLWRLRGAFSTPRAPESEAVDAARLEFLRDRSRFVSVCIDFNRDGTYARHRVCWYANNEWRETSGDSFDEAINGAMAAKKGGA